LGDDDLIKSNLKQLQELKKCLNEIEGLYDFNPDNPQFKVWFKDTRGIIKEIFGYNSDEWNRIEAIRFRPGFIDNTSLKSSNEVYHDGLIETAGTLAYFIRKLDRIEDKDNQTVKENLIPNEVILELPKAIQPIIYEINGCYNDGYYMACSVMCRKALEAAIYLKFEKEGKENELRKDLDNYMKLPKKIELAKQNRYITPQLAKELSKIKLFGDVAAHNLKITLNKEDLKQNIPTLRLALEEIFK
jgi:uncharacterized protein (UPF0128 family)